jgi:hypothetical protein
MTLDILEKLILTARLLVTTTFTLSSLLVPDIFDYYVDYNIKKINSMISNNNNDSNSRVQGCVQCEESRACDVAEESSGSCSGNEHEYDKVSTSESNQTESNEGEVSSK